MRSTAFGAFSLCLALAQNGLAVNIISSNDDGWAEVNIRTFFTSLGNAGYSTVVSAPAENQSGTGSSQKAPTALSDACEFNSCPAGSPPTGHNASEPRLNYVNSYPATSMQYGIKSVGPAIFGGKPDLAVAGPNVSVILLKHKNLSNSHTRLAVTLALKSTSLAPLVQRHTLLTMRGFQL